MLLKIRVLVEERERLITKILRYYELDTNIVMIKLTSYYQIRVHSLYCFV